MNYLSTIPGIIQNFGVQTSDIAYLRYITEACNMQYNSIPDVVLICLSTKSGIVISLSCLQFGCTVHLLFQLVWLEEFQNKCHIVTKKTSNILHSQCGMNIIP